MWEGHLGSQMAYVCKNEHVLIPLGRSGARTIPPYHAGQPLHLAVV